MGCFSACFRKSKRRKSRRPISPTPCSDQFLQRNKCVEAVQIQPTIVKEQEITEILKEPGLDSVDKQEVKLSISGRKKVTFDLDVQFYQDLPASDENHGNEEKKERREKETIKFMEEKNCNRSSDTTSSSTLKAFPTDHYRYQNCRDSDDEEFSDEVLLDDDDGNRDYMGDDEDEEEEEEDAVDEANEAEDESDESLFSRSITDSMNYDGDDEIKKSLDSVLHPIENLTQWKSIQARANNKLEQSKSKENKECEIPFLAGSVVKPDLKSKAKNSAKEIAVDTSLSSWLTGAEALATTPSKSRGSSVSVGNSPCSERTYSPKDFDDRPILGVLTVEEIRQFSAASTPRRSPSRSPDDMPIIGSVGSYWI